MKYLIGFFSSFILIYIIVKLQVKHNILLEQKLNPIRYSQSHVHTLISPLLPKIQTFKAIKKSQSLLHESRFSIKVIIMDNQAYWIKDSIFYMADMSNNGEVDKDTTRRVDTMTMDKVQLDKMMFIIDRLREGTFDDSGGTRN